MNNNDLNFYNEYFSKLEYFELKIPFSYNNEEKKYEGEILYKLLSFKVIIPLDYPFGDIKFITKDFEGLPHQMLDGSLCLNTNFVNHTFTRLGLEIDKLKSYIRDYYEKEVEDSYYEYPHFEAEGLVTLIFQEDTYEPSRFEKAFGQFKYSVLGVNNNKKNEITHASILVQNIGNLEYNWSSYYKKLDKLFGLWIFLENEPVHNKKNRYKNWTDLAKKLPHDFSIYFKNFNKSIANYKLFPHGLEPTIFLAVGYKIPSSNGFEVHWDLILLPLYEFKKQNQLIDNYKKEIVWDKTFNSSYKRFFGRGALNKQLANSKTLLIGNGAIGSTLSEILVRSGIRKIDITDIDIIEPGNICRSFYDFMEISFPKSQILKQKLEAISPFVEVNIINHIVAISPKSEKYFKLVDALNSYDLIIDCTANNEIIQMLTDMKLSNLICYLSISNKAKEMIFVTNSDCSNMVERRNQMLYSFGTFTEPEFREGTGCFHPTFEASYFDVNQLLNFSVRKINSFFNDNLPPRSFYCYINEDNIGVSEDVKFYQKDLNLFLTIESLVLEKIEQNSRKHYPNEFGGILMGSYINSYIDLVISDIIIPDKFKCSPNKFEPDHKDLNLKTKEYFNHFDNKIIYVGDWHSHPNGSNEYSQPDFKSTRDVAKSKTVNINNPILLIAAYSDNYFDPGIYVYNKDKLYKFERQL